MLEKTLMIMTAVAVAPHLAAANPAWCGSHQGNKASVHLAQDPDIDTAIGSIADALCPKETGSVLSDSDRAQLENLRAAWSQRLLMTDADWADVIAWLDDRRNFEGELSTKSLAAFTPVDQFIAIHQPLSKADATYLADALDDRLSEPGRLAYLLECTKDTRATRDDDDVGKWAVCQADMEHFDFKKLSDQLRADTVHSAAGRFWLRLHGYEMVQRIAAISAATKKLVAADAEIQKVFDTANAARAEWTKTVGNNRELLDLVLATDSGVLMSSRKQLDGCEAKTDAALAAAIATLPAKTFQGMHDDRDNPFHGFVHAVGPVLAGTPVTNLALIAYIECQPTTDTAKHFGSFINDVPGFRGPRSAAQMALYAATFKFDDPKAELQLHAGGPRPYSGFTDTNSSAGGVVKTIKKSGDTITVAIDKTKIVQEDCIAEHDTNRIAGFSGGKVNYQRVCDKTAMVTHDTTWNDFTLRATFASALKPGVVFSAAGNDLIAVWPSKQAKTPSWVLGAAIKSK